MNATDDSTDLRERLTRLEVLCASMATREDLARLELRMQEGFHNLDNKMRDQLRRQMRWLIGAMLVFWMAGAGLMGYVLHLATR